MQLRRSRSHRLPLLAAGALLASPLLTGCGFNYATDRVNTISAGVSDRSGSVDVLGAVVIAGQDDAGLFVATFVNKSDEEVEIDGVTQSELVQPSGTTEPVGVPVGGRASLFQTGGFPITGTFRAGDFLPVTLSFSNGQVTTVEVSVVPPCFQYSLDKLTELTLPGTTETEGDAPAEGTEPETEPGAETGEGETDTESARYSCEPLPAVEHGEGEGGEGEGGEGGEGEGGSEPGTETGTEGAEGTG